MDRNLVGSLIREQYRIDQRLGKGGFAEVYLATDTKFGARKVAIKVLLPEFSSHDEDIRRFLDEAKITGNIHDPNRHLIQVYEFGHWDGLYCIVLEYLEGRSLRLDMDRRLRPLAYAEALDIAGQVCEGLAAAHKNGVAHRDLKPDNIFLCPTPYGTNVKILDLGIAKVVDNRVVGELQHRSRVGVVLGTPAYLAPEMFSGKAVDYYLADIYSLGVVLYEMITGETPFQGESLAYYVYAHASVEPMRPSEVNTGIKLPDAVDGLVMRCLAKEPATRFRTPEELAGQIQAILAGETRSSRRPSFTGPTDMAQQEGRPSQRRAPAESTPVMAGGPASASPLEPSGRAAQPVRAPSSPVPDAPVQRLQKSRSPGQDLPPNHTGLPIAVGAKLDILVPNLRAPGSPAVSGGASGPNIRAAAPAAFAPPVPPQPVQAETAGPMTEPPASAPNETVLGLGFRPGMHRAHPLEIEDDAPEQGTATASPAGSDKQESIPTPAPGRTLKPVRERAVAPAPVSSRGQSPVQESESLRQVFIGLMFSAALVSIFTTGTLVLKIVDTNWMHATKRPRPKAALRSVAPVFEESVATPEAPTSPAPEGAAVKN